MSPFLPIVLAPFIGSFIGAFATRFATGRSWVWGRSACESCGHTLEILTLVPIVSWLALRGRCRHCDDRISPLYFVIESAAILVAAWAASVTQGWVLWASCGLGWCLLTLTATDILDGVLPDVLTLPLIPIGILVNSYDNPAAALPHSIGSAVGFSSFAIINWLYRRARGRDGLGWGDVKLLAAAGAWVSWEGLPSVVLIAAAVGLATTLIYAINGHRLTLDRRVAFGPGLALGVWLIWLYGPLG